MEPLLLLASGWLRPVVGHTYLRSVLPHQEEGFSHFRQIVEIAIISEEFKAKECHFLYGMWQLKPFKVCLDTSANSLRNHAPFPSCKAEAPAQ